MGSKARAPIQNSSTLLYPFSSVHLYMGIFPVLQNREVTKTFLRDFEMLCGLLHLFTLLNSSTFAQIVVKSISEASTVSV
jgi:hypothetical protein